MKKGFTLIELLAVIVILAIIALIAVPIVLNIIEETRDSANKRSIDLYAKSVENAIVRYRLKENKVAKSYEDIKDYIEYDGNKVECDTFIIHDDSTLYLGSCKVNEVLVKKYSYGTTTLGEAVLSNYGGKDKITSITDFTQVSTGLYKLEDDYGTSYYLRGNITDNYVQFGKTSEDNTMVFHPAGGFYSSVESCVDDMSQYGDEAGCLKYGSKPGLDMYWRIVRINGDGSIRLVYDGSEITENGNDNHDNYVGITNYGDRVVDGEKYINSAAKTVLDDWYTINLENKYNKYIADSIFCNDTEYELTDDNGNLYYNYLTNQRYENNTPQLTCKNQTDRYTVKDKINGNALLDKPIGLLSIDELLVAGLKINNKDNYLYSVQPSWTMSPRIAQGRYEEYMDETLIDVLTIYNYNGPGSDFIEEGWLGSSYNAVRPVINLKADVAFTGSGTLDDPYVIVTE